MHDKENIAFGSAGQIVTQQNHLLRNQLQYLAAHSPYYRETFAHVGFNPGDLQTTDDLKGLPFTTKDQLSMRNRDFLCVNTREIIEYVTTSGTLGTPVTMALTERDLQRLAYNECLSLGIAGCTRDDIIQIMVTLDKRFMAGMAYYLGARRLRAGIIRSGVDSPAFQLDTIARLQPTVIIAVPSYVSKLLDYAETQGFELPPTTIRRIICIGEPIRRPDLSLNPLGVRIQEKWPVPMFSTYASTEMATAFTECEAGIGGHHQPELIITELLDDQDQPVRDGEPGELVITTLGVEAMPLLRFRTGDICRRYSAPCTCGRHTYRLGPVEGRKQQMIKYKGTTLYPAAIFDVLNSFSSITHYVITLYTDTVGMDAVRATISTRTEASLLIENLKEAFLKSIRVIPEIDIVPEEDVLQLMQSPMSRKVIRLIDNRRRSA